MRIVELKIEDEYVVGGGAVVGAAGSANDVALRMTFSPFWDGLAKRVIFLDANGENPTRMLLLHPNEGTQNVYDVVVPAEAKAIAGDIFLSVRGVKVTHTLTTEVPSDWSTSWNEYFTESGGVYTAVTGDSAPQWAADTYYAAVLQKASMSAKTTLRVLESVYDENAEDAADVTPTQAEQIAAYLEGIQDTIDEAIDSADDAAESAEDAESSADEAESSADEAEAWATGEVGGVPVSEDAEQHHNNSKYYAEVASDKLDETEEKLKSAGCVYIGSDAEMPEGFNLQIDPNGDDSATLGDMTREIYDPTGKNQDAFAFAAGKVTAHNGDQSAHSTLFSAAAALVPTHNEAQDAHSALFAAKADLVGGKIKEEQIPAKFLTPFRTISLHIAHRALEAYHANTFSGSKDNLILADFSKTDDWSAVSGVKLTENAVQNTDSSYTGYEKELQTINLSSSEWRQIDSFKAIQSGNLDSIGVVLRVNQSVASSAAANIRIKDGETVIAEYDNCHSGNQPHFESCALTVGHTYVIEAKSIRDSIYYQVDILGTFSVTVTPTVTQSGYVITKEFAVSGNALGVFVHFDGAAPTVSRITGGTETVLTGGETKSDVDVFGSSGKKQIAFMVDGFAENAVKIKVQITGQTSVYAVCGIVL